MFANYEESNPSTKRKKCLLYDRDCINCGECNVCDLDPTKLCDNCMKCIQTDADYSELVVDKILNQTHTPPSKKR